MKWVHRAAKALISSANGVLMAAVVVGGCNEKALKTDATADAGDVVTFTVTLKHTGTSTGPSWDLVVMDALDPLYLLDQGSIATTTGEGITTPKTFTRVRRCVLVENLRII